MGQQLLLIADSRMRRGASWVILAIALFLIGVGQTCAADSFLGPAGAPATQFPKPDRPVAEIVAPLWHSEEERDGFDEPGQLVRLLSIRPGMTIADIGAGSGYLTVRLSPIVGPQGRIFAQDIEPSYLKDLGKRVKKLNLKNVAVSLGRHTTRGFPRPSSMWRSWFTCIMRSPSPTLCSTTSRRRSSAEVSWALSIRVQRHPGTAPLQHSWHVNSPLSATGRSLSIRLRVAIPISPSSVPPHLRRASDRRPSWRAKQDEGMRTQADSGNTALSP